MRIADLLEGQSINPALLQPHNTIAEASQLMADLRIGILIVVDEEQRIVGVLSERDIALAVGKTDANVAHVKVNDLMTKEVITCDPDETVVDSVYVMLRRQFRHLIVARERKPLGVLSMRDILKNIEPLLEEGKNKLDEQHMMEFLRSLQAA